MIKFRTGTKLTPPSISLRKKSAPKAELQKTVLIAIPNSVEFRNYKSNKVYKKAITLRNVSTSLARFQLAVRPDYSRFTVMIEYKGQRGGIFPGMHVRLVISFRSDVLDEFDEPLVINVQHGRSVVIKLRGYRDPPILKVINIPYLQCPQKEWHTMTRNVEWITELPFERTNSHEESDDSPTDRSNSASSTSTEEVLNCKKLKTFDCGECLVGEQVTLSLMVKNIGGEGRFFIMSEIDWFSMHIEVKI
ncbi:deleted in lung and esophageal cancer protein 1-like isoform X1 [Linepithema humile]|uniref:deleted in lung and esophageal cancer protein 1-like isoform X1 n=1 Tax=Linepithema humile TaxID=83485 RepID=UPI00351F43C2